MEALLSARAISLSLRGKKEIGINNKVAPATVLIQGSGTCVDGQPELTHLAG
jgi:hypothetical protein